MSNLIVTVKQGQLRGKTLTNRHGNSFYSFQGIPYAKPPLGNLRFKAPQPAEPWTGIRDATTEGSESLSFDMLTKGIVGSEDCLFLNVYTPNLPPNDTKLKAVMFFIHGGAFTLGSSRTTLYSPEHLLTEDIVLVTINYRLGLMGFLSMEDQTLGVPGNAGMKDMVMALKWVQENIHHFLGDHNNVTIFGESAGGASVHSLCLSPMAKGLFHRAIPQSGCAFNPWVISKTNSKLTAKGLGISFTNEKDLLQKLLATDAVEILKVQDNIGDDICSAAEKRPIGIVVEKQTNEPAFLPNDPWDILMSGHYNKVPMMLGYTSREGMIYDFDFRLVKPENRFVMDYEDLVPFALQVPRGSALSKKIAAKIKDFYANDEQLNESNIDKDYIMRTDIFFYRSIYTTAINHAATSNTPVYLYRVTVESAMNMYKIIIGCKTPGVCHADELGYLFKHAATPEVTPGSLEDISITRFVKLWTNFAKTGNPNPEDKDPLIKVIWKPVTKEECHFLDIGAELTVGTTPEKERIKFWDEILKMDKSIKQCF